MAENMDLKTLYLKREEGKKEVESVEYTKMTTEELGEVILTAGKKHQGTTLNQVIRDEGYNKWVASHVKADPKNDKGVGLYAYYLQRRLQEDLLFEEEQEDSTIASGSHQRPFGKEQRADKGQDDTESIAHRQLLNCISLWHQEMFIRKRAFGM